METKGAWQKISLSYTPDQACRYFLFGNFFSDAITPINMSPEERMKLDQSNQTLSDLRAKSLYDALLARQVPENQISWKGYGESKPVAKNDTEAGRQRNRRVILKKVS